MSGGLSEEQWRAIYAFQTEEIRRLATDRAFAMECSRRDAYGRIGEWLEPGEGKILEIGCGPGRYVAMYATFGYDVIGVDPYEYPDWKLLRQHTGATLQHNVFAESLPFPDDYFDHCICAGALLYFRDADAATEELRRVIKPGGRLFVRTVNRENLFQKLNRRPIDPSAPNAYTEKELKAFLERHGFEVSRTYAFGFYPPVLRMQWWRLVNGPVSLRWQEIISSITPRRYRHNGFALATAKAKS